MKKSILFISLIISCFVVLSFTKLHKVFVSPKKMAPPADSILYSSEKHFKNVNFPSIGTIYLKMLWPRIFLFIYLLEVDCVIEN